MNPLERKQSLIAALDSAVPSEASAGPVDRLPLWLAGRHIGTCYAHMTPRGMVMVAELAEEPRGGTVTLRIPGTRE